MLFTYTAPVLTGRLLGTESNSSPVTRIFLRWPSPNSLHSQLEGQPENKFLLSESGNNNTPLINTFNVRNTETNWMWQRGLFIKWKKQGRLTDSWHGMYKMVSCDCVIQIECTDQYFRNRQTREVRQTWEKQQMETETSLIIHPPK